MSQAFKNVYFPDYPAESANRKSLTLAFGKKDLSLYEAVKPLSSQQLRELLGHTSYSSLFTQAEDEGLALNTFCLRILRSKALQLSPDHNDNPPERAARTFSIDPLLATFRGGKSESLHHWYPLLEGYSPEFVHEIVEEFAPDARTILDPFAGQGTTPLTVASMGRQSYYCEINPVLQFVTKVKQRSLAMAPENRAQIARLLIEYSERLPKLLKEHQPDQNLRTTHQQAFGESCFFSPERFESVLRARTLVDVLYCTKPAAAPFFLTAILASLVPISLLIRRGDLRFRKGKELLQRTPSLSEAVSDKLSQMSADLTELGAPQQEPVLITEDARQLDKLPRLEIQAVVTSPPYLNGTNYFRNTKLELWFLRVLQSREELNGFRLKAITAGINDVTVGKPSIEVPASVKELVQSLQASAYDQRIPKMVELYFSDMKLVLSAIAYHLTSKSRLLIDIGDSAYGGIHVPTDALLSEILLDVGFRCSNEITLRKRLSRSGEPLRQKLLVFEKRNGTGTARMPPKRSWKTNWHNFQATLPHQSGVWAKRNWGHPLHSLCSYQGKMKPSLAAHLIEIFLPQGGYMLDPFGGVGTIPFEAALRGAVSHTFEISPVAYHIAIGKLQRSTLPRCEAVIARLEAFIRRKRPRAEEKMAASQIKFNKQLSDYYHERTFSEILLSRRFFAENVPQSPEESLVLACLLHILHGNRPYALSRRSHPITPFAPTGPTEYRSLIDRLRTKVLKSVNTELPEHYCSGKVWFQDATSWWPHGVSNLDAIITSPPFFDSTRFYLANWIRLWFCGWESKDFQTKPLAFLDERQKHSFDSYVPFFRQARERLKKDGVLVLHLGKSKKCDMAEVLAKTAKPWFRVADIFSESVAHCESHGIRDKGTVVEHSYLVLD